MSRGITAVDSGSSGTSVPCGENQGVDLGGTPTVEAVAENWGKISDLTGAKPRSR
jgi:hypothetical protein